MSPPETRPPVPHAAAIPTIATARAPARSGRGKRRTAASLTSSAGGPGGGRRARRPGLDLLLELRDVLLHVGDERVLRVLDEELLVELELEREVAVGAGRVGRLQELARVARRQLGDLQVDADVLLGREGEDLLQLRR